MRASLSIVLLAATVMVLSGCIDGSGAASKQNKALLGGKNVQVGRISFQADWAEQALTVGAGHDHKDASHHVNFSTPNFHTLGYDPLITDYYGRTAGDHGCGDLREKDGRKLSITHSFGTDIAFVIIDVTDPLKPTKIGEVVMPNTQVYDLALSPDLKWVMLATSPMDAVPTIPPNGVPPIQTMEYRDACSGAVIQMGPETGLPYHSGNVLVDITNPRNPNVVDFVFYPVLGSHSITITEINGKTIALSSVPNVPDDASFYAFMEIREVAGRGKIVPLALYRHPFEPVAGPVARTYGMHDGIIAKHPGTGKHVAYLAHGEAGLVILDVEDPSNPKYLGAWKDFGVVGDARPNNPYVHEAMPAPDLWEGRHYVWIGEECVGHPAKSPTCLIFGLDDTDPTKPTFVGAWTLPVDIPWKGLEYSLHYLALQNRTLFATAYHGGVWAIDVSTPEARATMPSIGAYLPNNVSPKKFDTPPRTPLVNQLYSGYGLENSPTVLDLNVLSDGTLVIYDMQSGVYTVRFDDQNPAPAPAPWPLGQKTE